MIQNARAWPRLGFLDPVAQQLIIRDLVGIAIEQSEIGAVLIGEREGFFVVGRVVLDDFRFVGEALVRRNTLLVRQKREPRGSLIVEIIRVKMRAALQDMDKRKSFVRVGGL